MGGLGSKDMFEAARDGNLENVKKCIKGGVDKESKYMDYTPLWVASYMGHLHVVQYLVEIDCNIKAQDMDGTTPILAAANAGHLEVLRFLLRLRINDTDMYGENVLHHAARNGHLHVVKWLIENQEMTPLCLTTKRQTPYDLAKEFQSVDDDDKEEGKYKVMNYIEAVLYKRKKDTEMRGRPLLLTVWKRERDTEIDEDEASDHSIASLHEDDNSYQANRNERRIVLRGSINDDNSYQANRNVIPIKWMQLFNTIDSELPKTFKWINGNGDELEISENEYRKMFKDPSLKEKSDLTDNGIYQCVRTYEGGKQDKINVVLHVSDKPALVTMKVHPRFWQKTKFENLSPKELQNKAGEAEHQANDNQHSYRESVEWKARSKFSRRYRQLKKDKTNPYQLQRYYEGEYKCTVSLRGLSKEKKEIYFFVVEFLNKTASPVKSNQHLTGVPSILTIKPTFLYFAYGSNLLIERITLKKTPEHIPIKATYITKACLQNYELDFISTRNPDESRWHGGVATIKHSFGKSVWGSVLKLNCEDIPHLDWQEGSYKVLTVEVDIEEEHILCRTYMLVRPTNYTDQWDKRPSPQYKRIIIVGAVQSSLPKNYITDLRKIQDNNNTKDVQTYNDTVKQMSVLTKKILEEELEHQ